MERLEPSLTEIYASWEFQEYSLFLSEVEAYYYARNDLVRQREQELWEAYCEREVQLQTMPYRLYLQTPEWAERAARARQRAGHRCTLCNADVPLEVHHRTYARRGVELEADLVALCPTCHGHFHEWLELAG